MKKKLPSKWCIKVEEKCTPNIIYEWRAQVRTQSINKAIWNKKGYLDEVGCHTDIKPVDCIELTLQEFKTLVLKEEPENYIYLIEFFRKLNIL